MMALLAWDGGEHTAGWTAGRGRVTSQLHAPHPSRPHRPHGLPPLPRHDDLRPAVRRDARRAPSSTARPRAASPSSTPPTSTRSAAASTTVGRTEEIVGRWLQGRRARLRRRHQVLRRRWAAAVGPRGSSRKHILDAIDGSLRRLQHRLRRPLPAPLPDPDTPLDETLRALDDLVRAGKVRYVGCSNFLAYQLARALGRSEALGLARFDSVQPRYNLLFREFERELLPLCREEGIGVIPYNPIAGRLALGQAPARSGPTEGTRFTLGNAARSATRTATGTSASSTPSRRSRRSPPRPACRWRAGGRVGAGQPGDHRADRRREPARAARRRRSRRRRSRSTRGSRPGSTR